jgi:hypothetical protein
LPPFNPWRDECEIETEDNKENKDSTSRVSTELTKGTEWIREDFALFPDFLIQIRVDGAEFIDPEKSIRKAGREEIRISIL